jgi:hypothetical protein
MKTITSTPSRRSFSSIRSGRVARCLALAICLGAVAVIPWANAEPGNDNRAPDVPTSSLVVTGANKVSFHAYAIGVQIYVATPSPANPAVLVWTFRAPEAVLYDSEGNVVGIHYAGPTWESESGSKVVAARRAGETIDATAIPWLKLQAVTSQGPGVFDLTTWVQRVNTVGGLAPSTPPAAAGDEARVPYTAEYYFYRESQH